MKPIYHSLWDVHLTPFCILLITSFQRFIAHSRDEQKGLIVRLFVILDMQVILRFYQQLLQKIVELPDADSFLQLHYSELLKCIMYSYLSRKNN